MLSETVDHALIIDPSAHCIMPDPGRLRAVALGHCEFRTVPCSVGIGSSLKDRAVRGVAAVVLAVAGAGFVVFDVVLAVVMPAQELQVVEVGWAAVGPVADVVGLAVAGWALAAGVLAVAVAGDERFPLGRGGDVGGAADVEDFGPAGHDHPAEGAVAQQELEAGGGEVVAPGLEADVGDHVGGDVGESWTSNTALTWGRTPWISPRSP